MNCTFIPINNDGNVEPSESFTISFSMFGGLPPGTPTPPTTVAMVIIIDDGVLKKEVNRKKLKIFTLVVEPIDLEFVFKCHFKKPPTHSIKMMIRVNFKNINNDLYNTDNNNSRISILMVIKV